MVLSGLVVEHDHSGQRLFFPLVLTCPRPKASPSWYNALRRASAPGLLGQRDCWCFSGLAGHEMRSSVRYLNQKPIRLHLLLFSNWCSKIDVAQSLEPAQYLAMLDYFDNTIIGGSLAWRAMKLDRWLDTSIKSQSASFCSSFRIGAAKSMLLNL